MIATSSGAAAAYVREGYSNIRIGMFLEIATTMGALLGAYLATRTPTAILAHHFRRGAAACRLACLRAGGPAIPASKTGSAGRAPQAERHLSERAGPRQLSRAHVKTGFGMMFGAGTLSGLLGIGSGALKVIAMDQVMRIPFKVSTTTSNFMIGVTAAASAGIYLSRGYIEPALAMPVMLGVLAGSLVGARQLVGARVRVLRWIFASWWGPWQSR